MDQTLFNLILQQGPWAALFVYHLFWWSPRQLATAKQNEQDLRAEFALREQQLREEFSRREDQLREEMKTRETELKAFIERQNQHLDGLDNLAANFSQLCTTIDTLQQDVKTLKHPVPA